MAAHVTDLGLKALAPLTQLESLNRRWVQGVGDAGMKELAGLKELRTLHLNRNKVTDAGVAKPQKALPGCRIDR